MRFCYIIVSFFLLFSPFSSPLLLKYSLGPDRIPLSSGPNGLTLTIAKSETKHETKRHVVSRHAVIKRSNNNKWSEIEVCRIRYTVKIGIIKFGESTVEVSASFFR